MPQLVRSANQRGVRLATWLAMCVLASAAACEPDPGSPPEALASGGKSGSGGKSNAPTGGKSTVGMNEAGANEGGAADGGSLGQGAEGGEGGEPGMAGSGGMSGASTGGGGAGGGGTGGGGTGGTGGGGTGGGGTGGGGTGGGGTGGGGTGGTDPFPNCGDGTVEGEECEPVSTALCSDDCMHVGTEQCQECEVGGIGICVEFGNSCMDYWGTAPEQALCYDVLECILATDCAKGASSLTSCFCGDLATPQCQTATVSGAGSPQGDCADIIREGLGGPTLSNLDVLQRFLMYDIYPGASAIQRVNCQKNNCAAACELN